MKSRLLHPSFARFLAALVAAGIGICWTGCATALGGVAEGSTTQSAAIGPVTGRVLTRADVRQQTATLYFGDETYAEVNSRWLERFYPEFRAELFRLGVVRWDARFDCNRFAEFYTSFAQARFYREMFQSRIAAQALAMSPFWYVRADGKGAHAIVQALTERGRMFIDPQTGREVQLTPIESATAYYRFF